MRFAPADIICDIFKENLIEQRKSDNSGRKKNPNQMTFCKEQVRNTCISVLQETFQGKYPWKQYLKL